MGYRTVSRSHVEVVLDANDPDRHKWANRTVSASRRNAQSSASQILVSSSCVQFVTAKPPCALRLLGSAWLATSLPARDDDQIDECHHGKDAENNGNDDEIGAYGQDCRHAAEHQPEGSEHQAQRKGAPGGRGTPDPGRGVVIVVQSAPIVRLIVRHEVGLPEAAASIHARRGNRVAGVR